MKKLLIPMIAVLLCMSLVLTGCGSVTDLIDDIVGGSSSSGTPYASLTADGRETGGYVDGRIGDTLQTVFFAFTVDKAEIANEYGGQAAPDGKSYLIAEITVKNTFGDVMPLWYDLFQIQWGKTDQEYGWPIEPFTDEQMPETYEMKKGETITYTHVFEIPAPEGEREYSISFLEYYEDGLEGNVFFVYFDL